MTPLLLLLSCGGDTAPAPVPSRVDAVVAAPEQPVDLDLFCEVRPPVDQAPTFAWPELEQPAPATTGGWHWVNVWATWCAPCIAELPDITSWPAKLEAAHAPVSLHLLSVDEDGAALAGFMKTHPEAQGSLHMTDGAQATAWVQSQGLDINPSLPLHYLVDPQGRIRCVRSGAVAHDALRAIQAVVEGG